MIDIFSIFGVLTFLSSDVSLGANTHEFSIPVNTQSTTGRKTRNNKGLPAGVIDLLLNNEPLNEEPQPSMFTAVPNNTRNGNPRGYIEYLPPNYGSRNDWPVVVYFHGIGSPTGSGSASDLQVLRTVEIGNYLSSEDRDFIVLVPQDHNGFWGNRAYSFVAWALIEY